MIPKSDITAWSAIIPWKFNEQVEQDLVISRALVDLYSDDLIKRNLAFRGGTALHKLFMSPAARYSEDIDLVQLEPYAIGELFDRIKEKLSYLGKPIIKQHQGNNTLIFRFVSEIPPVVPLKLKVEINCREHIVIYGIKKKLHQVESKWFSGECEVQTFSIEELLGSKIRALYQRKKGRDLFDLWYALENVNFDVIATIEAFRIFMEKGGHLVSQKEYKINMEDKITDPFFRGDIEGLLREGINFDIDKAYKVVRDEIINKI